MAIFLDNAATTALHPAVREAMQSYLDNSWGNPSSQHAFGRRARAALENARAAVAEAIGAAPAEIVFTSGGTEADALALCGILRASGKRTLVTSAIEHHAVLHTADMLAENGCRTVCVPPRPDGTVAARDVAAAVDGAVGLVSLMWANNETGAVQPVEEVAQALAAAGVPLHSDAVQAFPEIAIDVRRTPVAALTLSSHKIHGPAGCGALYLRGGTPFYPLIRGGAQERGRRAGTENVAAAVGFARAVQLLAAERAERLRRVRELRGRFAAGLAANVPGAVVREPDRCVSHIVNVAFPGVRAETLLIRLDLQGIAASSGSACTSGALSPSHVLMAMGLTEEEALSSVRFSFSSQNTEAEIDRAIAVLAAAAGRREGVRNEA